MRDRGFPAVRGEIVGDVSGYHYFPSRDQVQAWLDETGWQVVAEDYAPETGWGYRHLLLRRRKQSQPSRTIRT